MDPAPIPVICDRCGAQGLAGEADFADFGDLLDFEPVVLQVDRVDGFKPEAQRAFIAALAILGSADRAAKAIGKSATGAERLRTLPGAEGFNRAWERAKAISQEKGTLRLAASLRKAIDPAPSALLTPPPEPVVEELTPLEEKIRLELLGVLVDKYVIKLGAEREARLRGEIVAADFYLRQITALEVSLDVVSGNGMAILRDARLDGHDLRRIAGTEMSRLLDRARHLYWIKQGDPPRPDVVPGHLLQEHDGYATEYGEGDPGYQPGHEERRREITEQMKRDAEAQVEWEAEARRDYEARRASGADS